MKLKTLVISFILVLSVILSCSCNESESSSQSLENSSSKLDVSTVSSDSSSKVDETQSKEISSDNGGKFADEGELKLRIFKMGKSDAYLFRTSSKTVLIDCGDVDDAQEILDYFTEKSIDRIDYLILTHFDKKSIGGAANLVSSLNVGTVYEPDYTKKNTEYIDFSSALSNKNISSNKVNSDIYFEVDGVSFKISPCEKSYYSDDNNYSLMISVVHGDNSFLFVGDAKADRISEIISAGEVKHDFLMIPDNGTLDPKTEALIDAVSPTSVAITCSEKNPASAEVLQMLSTKGINTYLTTNGSIRITSDGSEIIYEQ